MPRFEKFYVGPSMVDATGNLKLVNFFSLFQEIASRNSDEIGIGKDKTTDNGIDWIISRVRVDFYDLIPHGETEEFYTYPSELKNGFIFCRNGGIRNKDNKILAQVSSMWALIDNKTRRLIMRPNLPYVVDSLKGETPLPLPEKVQPEECSFFYKRTMRYSDCDLNGHVNNTRYIEMISDIFPLDFYRSHLITRLDINYVNELHDGDEVNIYLSSDNTYVEGRVNDKVSFVAKIYFKNR